MSARDLLFGRDEQLRASTFIPIGGIDVQVGDLIVSDLHHPNKHVTTDGNGEASPLILGLQPRWVDSGEGLYRLERKLGGPR